MILQLETNQGDREEQQKRYLFFSSYKVSCCSLSARVANQRQSRVCVCDISLVSNITFNFMQTSADKKSTAVQTMLISQRFHCTAQSVNLLCLVTGLV